ncbi:MAG: hypothetical protein LBV37_02575 [Mycoplasmataceae bacterium]|jgi:uncharacterized protein with PQ loop repeat|nr:hypothetical protein [Mycoplasmataceae bacterium]
MTAVQQTWLWIFISIGFIGTLLLSVISIMIFIKCIKTKSYQHIDLKNHVLMMFSNIALIIYALGISIVHSGDLTFWNSVPTWAGNLLPLALNLFMVIGKIRSNRKDSHIKAK